MEIDREKIIFIEEQARFAEKQLICEFGANESVLETWKNRDQFYWRALSLPGRLGTIQKGIAVEDRNALEEEMIVSNRNRMSESGASSEDIDGAEARLLGLLGNISQYHSVSRFKK